MNREVSEIIGRIKKIEKEEKRRDRQPLRRYNAGDVVHEKQMAFHRCRKRNRWVFGGNRSGKTECGAVETVWLARGIHPFRDNRRDVSCWVVSLSQQVQRDVAQQKILHYLDKNWIVEIVMSEGRKGAPEYGVIDHIVLSNVFGGTSRIAFKSCEAGREKFQGTSLDFVWFDEEPPFDIYQECRMRVLDKKGDIFGTMTPLKNLSWVYDEIFLNKNKDAEVWCQFMEWNDNPFLDKNEIAAMSAALPPDVLESRRYGRFRSNVGLVYGEFEENVHVIEPFEVPTEWQDNLSIDPGLNNPLSCHWYARDGDGVVYVVAEHYEAGREVAYHAEKIREISEKLHWRKNKNGKISSLIDSAANQRTLSGMKTVAELFREGGVDVNGRVNKDVIFGINVVKGYLKKTDGRAKLYIFNTCVHLIEEMKRYFWNSDDRPKKCDDHALDELRYYLCSLPSVAERPAEKTVIQKDKDKLQRRLEREVRFDTFRPC